MTRKITSRLVLAIVAAAILPANFALAQQSEDGAPASPPPNVPAPGEPRAQEQLPEAPPEEMLKNSPPIDQKADKPADAAKPEPAPMPNTLPPAKKIEPKVPNT